MPLRALVGLEGLWQLEVAVGLLGSRIEESTHSSKELET